MKVKHTESSGDELWKSPSRSRCPHLSMDHANETSLTKTFYLLSSLLFLFCSSSHNFMWNLCISVNSCFYSFSYCSYVTAPGIGDKMLAWWSRSERDDVASMHNCYLFPLFHSIRLTQINKQLQHQYKLVLLSRVALSLTLPQAHCVQHNVQYTMLQLAWAKLPT